VEQGSGFQSLYFFVDGAYAAVLAGVTDIEPSMLWILGGMSRTGSSDIRRAACWQCWQPDSSHRQPVGQCLQSMPAVDGTALPSATATNVTVSSHITQRSGLFTCQPDAVPSEAPTRLQAAMQSLSKLAVGESPRSTLSPRSPPEGRTGGSAVAVASAQSTSATAEAAAATSAPPSGSAIHRYKQQHKVGCKPYVQQFGTVPSCVLGELRYACTHVHSMESRSAPHRTKNGLGDYIIP
jgi:hypothetical protein